MDVEPAACEPAAPVPVADMESTDPQTSVEAAPLETEVRAST